MQKMKSLICLLLIFILVTCVVYFPVSATENSSDTWEVGAVSNYGLLNDGFEPNVVEKKEGEGFTPTTLASYDPRTTNSETPVKNQGNIGACWAFGTTAMLENAVFKNTGLKYSYSEQSMRIVTSNLLYNTIKLRL